ncbi:MAG: glycosyltransferase family 39 protein [bacterium]|nr:glycosyltransferase family 39 protein [bacterium]
MAKLLKKKLVFLLGSKIIIFLLFFILFFISFYRLQFSPATWYDEGLNAGIAKSLVEDGVYSLKVGPEEFVDERQFLITTNYPVILPVAISLKIFGNSLTSARLPMILYLFLFALMAYLLVCKWFGKKSALMTLAFIVVFLPFYGNGKSVLGEVAGLFYLLAGLYIMDSKKLWKLFLSGILLGLSVATKPFFILILPALFIGEIYNVIKNGFRKPSAYAILIFAGLIPILFWFWTINPNFTLGNIGSALGYYSNSYADNTNIYQLVFSNIKRFVSETTPLHFAFMLVFSVWLIVGKIRKKEALPTQIALVAFILLNFLWYLKTPGWYRYFFPAHLMLFLFFPASVIKIFSKRIAFAIIIFFIIVQSFMLVSKRNEPLYFSSEVQDFVLLVNINTTVNDSLLVVNSPSVAFLLDQRNVSQYVRINPELVFAPKYIKNHVDLIHDTYIVVGALSEQDIEIRDLLANSYEKVEDIGHQILYKRLE